MEINLNLSNVVPSLLSIHILLVVNKSKIINIVKRCISISTYTIRLANQLLRTVWPRVRLVVLSSLRMKGKVACQTAPTAKPVEIKAGSRAGKRRKRQLANISKMSGDL